MKFGKIDEHDLHMSVYSKDSSASAVVLGDYGNTSFRFSSDKGWYISMTRHKRIKILNKNGLDQANFAIKYYAPESGTVEKIIGLKGTSYTIEGSKTVKTKLSKSGIFDERINKYWKQRKFTIPNVKVGSVIEFEYIVDTEYWRYLRDWEFQSTIPIVQSEYRVKIPEFFTYKTLMQGYHPLDMNQNDTEREEFPWKYTNSSAESREAIVRREGTIQSLSKRMRFVSTNVPAFLDEPYMASSKNFISKVKFELAVVQFKGEMPKNYLGTWEAMNTTFLEHQKFGIQVARSGFLNKIVESLVTPEQTDAEKVKAIYDHFKSTMTWSGFNGKWVSFTLKKAYEEKKGDASDINLMLTSALQKAGIDASPVLLSTRSNGFSQTEYPDSEQFNYVVCQVNEGGKTYFLDATDPLLPMSMIPQKCVNGKGWIVSKTKSGWTNLSAGQKNLEKITMTVNLSEDGTLSGDVKNTFNGYKARAKRKVIIGEGEDTYITKRKEKNNWTIEDMSVTNGKTLGKPLSETFKVTMDSEMQEGSDIFYLNPMLSLKESKNPFKTVSRKFPVDFGTTSEKTFLLSLTLPEGYTVEELPGNTAFILPGKSAKFQYTVSTNGNKVTILSRIFVYKPIFSQLEYADLRAFYEQVVAKHAETLVIKKI